MSRMEQDGVPSSTQLGGGQRQFDPQEEVSNQIDFLLWWITQINLLSVVSVPPDYILKWLS